MAEAFDQFPIHPLSRTKCEHRRVRLGSGWSGLVMTACAGGELASDPDEVWPTTSQWADWLKMLIRAPDSLPGREVLKQSGKGEVIRAHIELPNRRIEVVCKRGAIRGIGRRSLAMFRRSPARRQFDKALGLLQAGIRTPLPLACLRRGFGGPEAWLVTAFVPDAVDLDHIALALLSRVLPDRQRSARNGVIEALAVLFDRLEMHRVHHRDLKASNVMLTAWDAGSKEAAAWLIDLEGVRLNVRMDESRAQQPLVRLTASLVSYSSVTKSDYCRFLHAYLPRMGTSPTQWKKHFRRLGYFARRYLEAAKQRKTHKLDGYSDGV
ncbi:MAG: hypothetical protein IH897_01505 [Planctomycetes bacterium]|nr:hypothetical protein [Planctomycetota bacterium]